MRDEKIEIIFFLEGPSNGSNKFCGSMGTTIIKHSRHNLNDAFYIKKATDGYTLPSSLAVLFLLNSFAE